LNRFNVIVPVYNAERWIGQCLESILSQDYPYYDVLVIDDCSSDYTWEIIKSYKVNAVQNESRHGALYNIVWGIDHWGKDIIVTIDGDDWLADNTVFSHLDSVYNRNVWMSYGSFVPVSGKYKNTCQSFDKIKTPCEQGWLVDVKTTPAEYRRSGLWVTSHLRTFRKNLWDLIEDNDLRDNEGEYYKVAWDLAFMYPMIEMAAERVRFIEKIMYIYNDLNPLCDMVINTNQQVATGKEIQNKRQYARINGDIL